MKSFKDLFKIKRSKNNEVNYTPYSGGLRFGKYQVIDPLYLSAVYAAMELISNSIACMPITVKTQNDSNFKITSQHPLANLFKNLRQSKYIFIKQLLWDMMLYGNSFAYIVRKDGKPIDLIYLRANCVSVQYEPENDRLYYLVSGYKNVPNRIEPDDMLHFFKNSKNGYVGVGILAYAYKTLQLAGYAESAAEDYFGSGCSIKGILKFLGTGYRDNDQKEKARQSWNEVHGGSNGSGLAIMDADCDFIPVTQSANESQLLETREFNIQEIARFFCINPVLLQDLSNSSYSTIEAANIEFVQHTLLPYIIMMENEFTRKLSDDNKIMINIDETMLLRGDKQTMADYISRLKDGGVITTNEARDMIDLGPIENGDKIIIPYTNINDNTVN